MDVAILGGGTAGTMAAMELAKRGARAHVIDSTVAGALDHVMLLPRPLGATVGMSDSRDGILGVDRLEMLSGHGQRATLKEADLLSTRASTWARYLRAARKNAAIAETIGQVAHVRRHGTQFEIDVRMPSGEIGLWHATHVIDARGIRPRSSANPHAHSLCAQEIELSQGLEAPMIRLATIEARGTSATVYCISITPSTENSRVATLKVFGPSVDLTADDLIGRAIADIHRDPSSIQISDTAGSPVMTSMVREPSSNEPEQDVIVVGGAAGLFNALTGDGIHVAATSGTLAARAIAEHSNDARLANLRFHRRLRGAHVGLDEDAGHTRRRQQLTRRVLIETLDDERPFFAKARRAIVLPQGIGGLITPSRASGENSATHLLKPFTLACDEVIISAVRREWPLLASVLRQSPTAPLELRPSSLFGLSYLAAGGQQLYRWSSLGAAVELSTLGSLALLASSGHQQATERGIDYQTAAATLAGDFLLARSSKIAAQHGSRIAAALAGWLEEIISIRLDRAAGAQIFAAMFEMPARLGAGLSASGGSAVDALSSYGAHFGSALSHAEDKLALMNRRTRLDTTLAGLQAAGLSNVRVDLSAAGDSTECHHEVLGEAVRLSRCACESSVSSAMATLDLITHVGARASLADAARSLLTDDLVGGNADSQNDIERKPVGGYARG